MREHTKKTGYLLKRSLEKAMGKALDYARISGMSDRSFEQFERSIKHDFNRIIEQSLELLCDAGIITRDEVRQILKNQ